MLCKETFPVRLRPVALVLVLMFPALAEATDPPLRVRRAKKNFLVLNRGSDQGLARGNRVCLRGEERQLVVCGKAKLVKPTRTVLQVRPQKMAGLTPEKLAGVVTMEVKKKAGGDDRWLYQEDRQPDLTRKERKKLDRKYRMKKSEPFFVDADVDPKEERREIRRSRSRAERNLRRWGVHSGYIYSTMSPAIMQRLHFRPPETDNTAASMWDVIGEEARAPYGFNVGVTTGRMMGVRIATNFFARYFDDMLDEQNILRAETEPYVTTEQTAEHYGLSVDAQMVAGTSGNLGLLLIGGIGYEQASSTFKADIVPGGQVVTSAMELARYESSVTLITGRLGAGLSLSFGPFDLGVKGIYLQVLSAGTKVDSTAELPSTYITYPDGTNPDPKDLIDHGPRSGLEVVLDATWHP